MDKRMPFRPEHLADGYLFQPMFTAYRVPPEDIQALERYVNDGIQLGSFLEAVVSNEFKEIVTQADPLRMNELPAYASFIYSHLPSAAQGSRETVNMWMASFYDTEQETEQNG